MATDKSGSMDEEVQRFTKVYDTHTMYVHTTQTKEQVIADLGATLKTLKRRPEFRSLECDFRVNIPSDKEGRTFGHAYVYVSNPQVYHMLLKRKPDGSPNVRLTPDPNWTPPPPKEEVDPFADGASLSWADLLDEEEEESPPMIAEALPPLLTLGTEQDYVVEPAALMKALDHYQVNNVLYSRAAPPWLSEIEIKKIFQPYATRNSCTYPRVTFSARNEIFVTFDPGSHDARFALLMARKIEIPPGSCGSTESTLTTLIFSHASHKEPRKGTFGDGSERPPYQGHPSPQGHPRSIRTSAGNEPRSPPPRLSPTSNRKPAPVRTALDRNVRNSNTKNNPKLNGVIPKTNGTAQKTNCTAQKTTGPIRPGKENKSNKRKKQSSRDLSPHLRDSSGSIPATSPSFQPPEKRKVTSSYQGRYATLAKANDF